jgi:Uma2 family endonuclease
MGGGRRLVTVEEPMIMPEVDCHYELLDGELVELPFHGMLHGVVLATITAMLYEHVRVLSAGEVLAGNTGIILHRNPDRVRAPDACFIAYGACGRLPDDAPYGYLELVPDLIVEINDPWDVAAAIREKTDEWLRAGARLVWTVDPEARTVAVNEAPGAGRVLHVGDTLTGQPVLPGFALPLAQLFA